MSAGAESARLGQVWGKGGHSYSSNDMEEHLRGIVEPQYHLCPLVGPSACQPHQDAGGSQQELLRPQSLLLTRAIDTHLLLIGVDSSSGVRKEEASFPRPRCPMQGPKPSRILPSTQQGSRRGHCWGSWSICCSGEWMTTAKLGWEGLEGV